MMGAHQKDIGKKKEKMRDKNKKQTQINKEKKKRNKMTQELAWMAKAGKI